MELSELTDYAEQKYHIREAFKWADFPRFSVLAHPETGKWIALLMRQWDTERGAEIERCDIKYRTLIVQAPYLAPPFRMKGSQWTGVIFDQTTDRNTVFELFDRAFQACAPQGYTIVMQQPRSEGAYHDSPIQLGNTVQRPENRSRKLTPQQLIARARLAQLEFMRSPDTPQPILDMIALYQYPSDSREQKTQNFIRQGKFMETYEDNAPWNGEFKRFFPTYHDLNIPQLRGYFTWRAQIRKGIFTQFNASISYIYLYELLCGIGTTSPEDSLRKMHEFETGYIDAGLGDAQMRATLRRWMLGYAVMHGVSKEIIFRYINCEASSTDCALIALKDPENQSDDAIFSALVSFLGDSIAQSPVLTADEARGKRMFAELWRVASRLYARDGRTLFYDCFRDAKYYPWNPLSNAIHEETPDHCDAEFELNACRSFRCRKGIWEELRYDMLYFNTDKLKGLFHEADRAFRKYLKTGRGLRRKPDEAWAEPFAEAVIAAEERAKAEAARPKITLDLGGLERIRQDAMLTQDSLLTEADRAECIAETQEIAATHHAGAETYKPLAIEAPAPESAENRQIFAENAPNPEENNGAPGQNAANTRQQDAKPRRLDDTHSEILSALLRGEDALPIIRAHRLMASIVADTINEAFYDDIGDSILESDGTALSLVEDYRDEVAALTEDE
ncbi:MAG: TerB N-terminal domain-containing protein [Proteobacteria bacterium]|nr:TerB N-terminal domain-containing protein [Pseudomonadota bacterium]